MKIKILDEFSYQSFPITDDMIEVDEETLKRIGTDKKFDIEKQTVVDFDNSFLIEQAELNELRKRREEECFAVVNRGKLWYNTLTIEQEYELQEWYFAWLNVTETKLIPERPAWVDGQTNEIITEVI